MNIEATMAAFAGAVFFCLALYALRSDPPRQSGRICALLCINESALSLVYLFTPVLRFEINDQILYVALAIGWGLIPAILLHFSLRLDASENRNIKYIIPILYLPMMAFLFRAFESKLVALQLERGLLSWTFGTQFAELWAGAYTIYFALYFTVATLLIFRYFNSEPSHFAKRTAFLAIAGAVPIIGFIAAADYVDFGIEKQVLAPIAFLGIFVWLAFVWDAISKPIKTRVAQPIGFEEILRHMSDLLVIIDEDGRIVRVNSRMLVLLGYDERELLGRRIEEIALEEDYIRNKLARIRHGLYETGEMHLTCLTKEGMEVSVLLMSSAIGNGGPGAKGIIMVGSLSAPAANVPVAEDEIKEIMPEPSLAEITMQEIQEASTPDIDIEEKLPDPLDARFRHLVEQALVGIFIEQKGKLTYVNKKMAAIFGYSQDEIIDSLHLLDLVEESDRILVGGRIDNVLSNGNKSPHFSFRGRQKDGGIIDVEAQGTSAEFDGQSAVIGSLHEITERKMLEDAMRHQALHDPLTSLPNRMLFSDRLDMAISKASREQSMIAVMFLDLDRFKNINDTHGHNAGDMLLQSIAGVLRSCLRESDTVARLGGDEFTILLTSISDGDAIKVARKILSAVNQKWNISGHKVQVTTSVGISVYPDDAIDSEALVRKADTAMYHAKAHGGNAIKFYEQHMDVGSLEQIQLENDLRVALDNGELFIYYQPQFDMLTKKVSGVEALLRWNHPDRGLIMPDDFIPIAERTGMIVPIGEWVLGKSCAQIKSWQSMGYSSLQLAVNISGIQLHESNFTEMVEGIIAKTGFDSTSLKLEITESVALQNLESIVPKLTALTEKGVQFAIDDFGMGYSSLYYLKRLPIQTIKIDRSFMRDLGRNEEDASIVTAVIAMAKSLKLDTIAEGVETREQFAFLNKCQCDKMQGFLYSQPLSPSAIEALLK